MLRAPGSSYLQAEVLLATLEHLGEGISVIDRDLNVLAYNSRALELLDFPADEAANWTNLEQFFRYNAERGEYGAGNIDALVRDHCELARRMEPHCFRRRRPNGAVIEVRGAPIPAGGFVSTYRDVTEEVRNTEALRKERDLRQRLVDALPGIFYLIAADGRFLWWNRNFEQVTGYRAEEMQRLHPLDLFEGEERDLVATALGAVFENGRAEVEATLAAKNGRHTFYYFNGVRIDIDGEPALIGLGIDITERKTAENLVRSLNATLEERVRQRTGELEVRNRELEAFSYSVAHDLRGPLRAIDGFAHLIADDYGAGLPDEGRQYLQRIRGATQRMGDLIDDILDLARVSRQEINRLPVDLTTLVATLRRELEEHEPERRIAWVIAAEAIAQADPILIGHVIDNLIRNAWKFTAERDPASIEFGVVAGKRRTTFFVRDNGAGFDMAYADKLFKPFQRLHGVERFAGTGIGLAIAERVVRRHGGRIWTEAAAEQGACFYFELPND